MDKHLIQLSGVLESRSSGVKTSVLPAEDSSKNSRNKTIVCARLCRFACEELQNYWTPELQREVYRPKLKNIKIMRKITIMLCMAACVLALSSCRIERAKTYDEAKFKKVAVKDFRNINVACA